MFGRLSSKVSYRYYEMEKITKVSNLREKVIYVGRAFVLLHRGWVISGPMSSQRYYLTSTASRLILICPI